MRPIFCALFLFAGFFLPAHAQIITTICGNGTAGFTGDGGLATAATLDLPEGLYRDNAGNIFFTDEQNQRVRKIDLAGVITTIAGSGPTGLGAGGYSGDSGPATSATLNNPWGVAADNSGNIYISDWGNDRVRKVDALGIITTIAGTGSPAYGGDGGPATAAQVNSPIGIAADGEGDIYFADRGNQIIRKINGAGIISTYAGTPGSSGFSGDGGPATAAQLNYASFIYLGSDGTLYLSDPSNNRIRKVNPAGTITTIAGTGVGSFYGDGGPATAALIWSPEGLTLDGCGNLYFNDGANSRIRKINTFGIISTIAGSGVGGYSGDGGDPLLATIEQARGIATDSLGNVYITGYTDNYIRKIFIVNHPPMFAAGDAITITVCDNGGAKSLDSVLAINDADTGQTETWTALAAPAHGTVMAPATAMVTGGLLTPAGLSYTPAAGYAGADSFKILVSDCAHGTDTVTVHVNIIDCALRASNAANDEYLLASPNPSHGTFSVIIHSVSDEPAEMVVTDLTGQKINEINTITNTRETISAGVPPGIYFLSVTTSHGRYFEKIIFE